MEENRLEQKEALQTLVEFNERLVKNMNIIVKELSGQRLDDTDKFLKGILDAVNWEVQVMKEKGGYEHFMLKEIHEQPKAVQDTIGAYLKGNQIDFSEIGLEDEELASIERFYIIGCGSASEI